MGVYLQPVIGNGLMVEISTLPARNTGASRRKRNTDDMRFTRDAKNGMTILVFILLPIAYSFFD